ncbi:MAG: hypothetical protein RL420_1831 [Pseudomonadota bacterium]
MVWWQSSRMDNCHVIFSMFVICWICLCTCVDASFFQKASVDYSHCLNFQWRCAGGKHTAAGAVEAKWRGVACASSAHHSCSQHWCAIFLFGYDGSLATTLVFAHISREVGLPTLCNFKYWFVCCSYFISLSI